MKYCPYCGNTLDDDMDFCPKCGKAYKGEASEPASVLSDEAVAAKEVAAEQTKRSKKPIWIAAAAVAVVSIAVCVVCLLLRGGTPADSGNSVDHSPAVSQPIVSTAPDEPAVSESVAPAVTDGPNADEPAVGILDDSERLNELTNSVVMLECYDSGKELLATGSGFFAFNDSTIVTNYHVVNDGVCSIKVRTESGRTFPVSHVIAYDQEKDIAILKISNSSGITPLSTGDSDQLSKGETVVAIGSPLGLINSVSDGIISGFVDEDSGFIQFTAAISHGSSGGALLNERGEVIGMTAGSFEDGQSLNLAIPIAHVCELWANKPSEADYVSIADFSKAARDYLTVEELWSKRAQLDGTRVTVCGYISSTEITDELNRGRTYIRTRYYLVDNRSDVYNVFADGRGGADISDAFLKLISEDFRAQGLYATHSLVVVANEYDDNSDLCLRPLRPQTQVKLSGTLRYVADGGSEGEETIELVNAELTSD